MADDTIPETKGDGLPNPTGTSRRNDYFFCQLVHTRILLFYLGLKAIKTHRFRQSAQSRFLQIGQKIPERNQTHHHRILHDEEMANSAVPHHVKRVL